MILEDILETVCKEDSISGNEHNFIDLLSSLLKDKHNCSSDNLGNLLIIDKQSDVLITTAVDEVGLVINKIEDDGSLRFLTIGEIESEALVGSIVEDKNIVGVIGQKPVHLQTKSERKAATSIDDLFIDIGAKCKSETEGFVNLGDVITFQKKFIKFGEDRICSKSINSKVGSAIVLTLLNLGNNLNCAFLTKTIAIPSSYATSSYVINPKVAILIDLIEECELKEDILSGKENTIDFVLSYKTQIDQHIFDKATKIAKENKFNFVIKVSSKISDYEKAILQTRSGIQIFTILIPCRQANSPYSNVSITSLKNAVQFIQKLVSSLD